MDQAHRLGAANKLSPPHRSIIFIYEHNNTNSLFYLRPQSIRRCRRSVTERAFLQRRTWRVCPARKSLDASVSLLLCRFSSVEKCKCRRHRWVLCQPCLLSPQQKMGPPSLPQLPEGTFLRSWFNILNIWFIYWHTTQGFMGPFIQLNYRFSTFCELLLNAYTWTSRAQMNFVLYTFRVANTMTPLRFMRRLIHHSLQQPQLPLQKRFECFFFFLFLLFVVQLRYSFLTPSCML